MRRRKRAEDIFPFRQSENRCAGLSPILRLLMVKIIPYVFKFLQYFVKNIYFSQKLYFYLVHFFRY